MITFYDPFVFFWVRKEEEDMYVYINLSVSVSNCGILQTCAGHKTKDITLLIAWKTEAQRKVAVGDLD